VALILRVLGEALHRSGHFFRALLLYWAAKNIAVAIGAWQQDDEAVFGNFLAACCAQMDESEYAAALEQGRPLAIEQAITIAREELSLFAPGAYDCT
jgi:hypothetical protein